METFVGANTLRLSLISFSQRRRETTQADWVRGCRFRAIIKVVKIWMTAGFYDFVELFVALDRLKLVCRSMATFQEFRLLLILTTTPKKPAFSYVI